MKCPYCQHELPEHSQFCSYCGEEIKVQKKCPQCYHSQNIDAVFCSYCGYHFQQTKEDKELTRSKKNQNKNKNKKMMMIIISIIICLCIGLTGYFLLFKEEKAENKSISNEKQTELKLDENKFEIEVEQQDYIEANMNCTYEVDNEDIVKVDQFGTITGLAPGTATVTVKGENGEKQKCQVVVSENTQNIVISSYEASSTLTAEGYDYSVNQLYDQNYSTCWTEGVEGDGIGQTVTVNFESRVKINTLNIVNGYNKTYDLYQKNNRVKKVTLIFDDGSEETVELKDSFNISQSISFTEKQTKTVKVRIDEVYKGTKYEDTCLTEMTLTYKK